MYVCMTLRSDDERQRERKMADRDDGSLDLQVWIPKKEKPTKQRKGTIIELHRLVYPSLHPSTHKHTHIQTRTENGDGLFYYIYLFALKRKGKGQKAQEWVPLHSHCPLQATSLHRDEKHERRVPSFQEHRCHCHQKVVLDTGEKERERRRGTERDGERERERERRHIHR